MNTLEKIESKLVLKENGCKEWSGYRTKRGYGQIGIDYKIIYVHRAIYLLKNGIDLKTKKVIRHKCDNPSCANIEHLEIGTQKDNMDDAKNRGRNSTWKMKFCRKGHIRTPENLYTHKTGSKSCRICTRERRKNVVD